VFNVRHIIVPSLPSLALFTSAGRATAGSILQRLEILPALMSLPSPRPKLGLSHREDKPKIDEPSPSPSLAEVQQYACFILCALAIVLFNLAWDWCVGQRCQSECMPTVTSRVVECLRVLRNTLVPDHYRSGFIPNSAAEVLSAIDMVEQKLKHIICRGQLYVNLKGSSSAGCLT
jgi:hypothetical protein